MTWMKILGVIMGIFVLLAITTKTSIGINRTPSLPYLVFLTVKGMQSKKGDLVAIKDHKTAYYPKVTFIKRLTGVAGDKIEISNDSVRVNGQYLGSVLHSTSWGSPLTPIKSQKIPEGHVFVTTEHERSFDSRYEEFGLVPKNKLQGRVFVLW